MASDPSQKVLIIGEPYFSDVVADTFRTKRPEMELISDTLLANVKSELLASDVLVFQLSNGVEDATTALKILTHSKFENEKTFILVSSVQTWAETRPRTNIDLEVEATNADDDDDGAGGEDEDTFTEDMYNMRVPHVKYSAWKEVEKLVKQANGPLLHTYVLFAGLLYGEGEDKLHPVFKQAWHRAPEGLPIFGSGKNPVPMIHIRDLSTFVFKFATRDRKDDDAGPDDQRYFFATDQGNCSWHQIIKAINDTMGIGKTYRVLERDFVLYENIEHFIIGLRVEAQGITTIMEDEEEWVAQAGFVENIQKVVQEYKVGRKVLPLRICVNGPPASGKTYYSRKLLDHFNLPHFTIKDVIQQYEQQEVDLREELQRRKRARREAARRAKQEEKRAEGEGGEGDDDDDDDGNDDRDDQLDDDLDPDAMDPDADDDEEEEDLDEESEELTERLKQVKAVLSMKIKTKQQKEAEEDKAAGKQNKKKPAGKKGGKAAGKGNAAAESTPTTPDEQKKPEEPPRYQDRCLAIMYRWKLAQPACRNQGWIMDGFPKTVTQARLLMEEGEIDIPEEGEEIADGLDELPEGEEPELKKVEDALLPDYVLCLNGTDQFLTERVMKLGPGAGGDSGAQGNRKYTPENFQRRLAHYKTHNKPLGGVATYLESVLTNSESLRDVFVRDFQVDDTPLVPPPLPSILEEPPVDPVFTELCDFIGAPHNYGPTPQEIETQRMLELQRKAEQERIREEEQAKRAKAEAADKELLAQQQKEEALRLAAIQAQEREMLEVRKEPLKLYLMENVIPLLTKGLIEVCEVRPTDPIDYLAEWLFRHNPHIE
eukprot:TRINITY_DN48919_c0_g1_i2.p1 TRINITY_DN48919_c0_g1~~TRINITY_DN48919_c0_g1_i2.p1  ORF type:complete len:826 (+),score=160.59 TRINITY_DN48919_c0_g1_i2:58-2535(+)